MAFDARQIHADAASLPRFEFVGLDGNTYSLPNIKTLSAEDGERFQRGDTAVIEESNPEAFAQINKFSMSAAEAIAQAWIEHGGQLGKAL